MHCYECARQGVRKDAVALCHSCSAGLCTDHVMAVPQEVNARMPILRVVSLPLQGRRLLCPVCKAALEQPGAPRAVPANEGGSSR